MVSSESRVITLEDLFGCGGESTVGRQGGGFGLGPGQR